MDKCLGQVQGLEVLSRRGQGLTDGVRQADGHHCMAVGADKRKISKRDRHGMCADGVRSKKGAKSKKGKSAQRKCSELCAGIRQHPCMDTEQRVAVMPSMRVAA